MKVGHCESRTCRCAATKSTSPTWETLGCPADIIRFQADQFCQDITNIEACDWDNGDCCRRYVFHACLVCRCHEDNQVHLWLEADWVGVVHYENNFKDELNWATKYRRFVQDRFPPPEED